MANWQKVADQYANQYGIPTSIFRSLVKMESGWNPNAVSPAGAVGLAQLMPATARGLGVNPRDPKQNLLGGARYLAEQYKRFGSWELALAAYNAGPGRVQDGSWRSISETSNYVRKVLAAAALKPGKPRQSRQAGPLGLPGAQSATAMKQAALANLGDIAMTGRVDPVAQLGNLTEAVMASPPSDQTTTVQGGAGTGAPSSGPKSLSGLAELIYDPMGEHYVDGGVRVKGAHGGHDKHLHFAANNEAAVLRAIKKAQAMGLTVREHPSVDRVDPVHTKDSYHYRGLAADISGSPARLRAFYRWAARTFR